jgi:hypothetical protein
MLTALKIVAGIAVLGLVATLMVAVVSGIASSICTLRRGRKEGDRER